MCVIMTPSPPFPFVAGAVRLIGGSNSSEGRVEIYNSGQWGTICDDGWNINDAIVVCKELGFPTALSSFSNAYFGSGTGVIWMDNVRCTGLESHLSSCTFNGWGIHNCGHYEDAGVRCMERTSLIILMLNLYYYYYYY